MKKLWDTIKTYAANRYLVNAVLYRVSFVLWRHVDVIITRLLSALSVIDCDLYSASVL